VWTYVQDSGQLFDPAGKLRATGYSGFPPDGRNNPSLQNEADIGPIPCGFYTIGPPEYVAAPGPHGPYVLPLDPDAANEMFGRSGFLCHGDSIAHAGHASHGCIIFPYDVRIAIATSGDNRLEVVATAPRYA